ncbi:hypothetical protein WA026_005377 [Henosepilachna vigintioctopunctata]|uniref:Septin n=1 Tax=Henosepilachna vigintioctopunctata TaxID=420089 RepID=A0AAW1U2Z9_9CUCU
METEIRHLELNGYVGFDSLPYNYVTRAKRKGFVLNVLCVGESGIGKKTLMDSLFKTTLETDEDVYYSNHTVFKSNAYVIKEQNISISLNLCRTVNYGDDMNRKDSLKAITDHVDRKFELYFQQELNIRQKPFDDFRIHVCLYFVCPTGVSLKPLDVMCMKMLAGKLNLVPVIAKADTMSMHELGKFKENILKELKRNNVQIYYGPLDEPPVEKLNAELNSRAPFAVVGSTDFVIVDGEQRRARKYPWGIIEVENEEHCDLPKLREMLIQVNLEDLIEKTHHVHYEMYRKTRLERMGLTDSDVSDGLIALYKMLNDKCNKQTAKLAVEESEIVRKMEARMRFILKELDKEERDMRDKFREMEEDYLQQKRAIKEAEDRLNEEIVEFRRMVGGMKKAGSSHNLLSSSSHNLLFSIGKRK